MSAMHYYVYIDDIVYCDVRAVSDFVLVRGKV